MQPNYIHGMFADNSPEYFQRFPEDRNYIESFEGTKRNVLDQNNLQSSYRGNILPDQRSLPKTHIQQYYNPHIKQESYEYFPPAESLPFYRRNDSDENPSSHPLNISPRRNANFKLTSHHMSVGTTLTKEERQTILLNNASPKIEDSMDDCENKIILEVGPGGHQIKEYNIRPVNIIKVNYTPSNSDILVVKLKCDPTMKLKDYEFFLTAMSPKYQTDDSDRLYLPNLKISKDMLKGRTKGYKFNLVFSLFIKGKESYKVISDPFFLWSNVNQAGFPREERDSYSQSENRKRKRSISSSKD